MLGVNDMRLIDADALMEHIYRDRLDSRERIAQMIKNAPTIEPERKTGRWIFTHMFTENGASFPGYACSECNEWHGTNAYRYCPDCGAYMGG